MLIWWFHRVVRGGFSEEEKLRLSCEIEPALGRTRERTFQTDKTAMYKDHKGKKKNRKDTTMAGR